MSKQKNTTVVDPIAKAWSSMTSADRFALLGHDRDELTAVERAKFSKMAQLAKS